MVHKNDQVFWFFFFQISSEDTIRKDMLQWQSICSLAPLPCIAPSCPRKLITMKIKITDEIPFIFFTRRIACAHKTPSKKRPAQHMLKNNCRRANWRRIKKMYLPYCNITYWQTTLPGLKHKTPSKRLVMNQNRWAQHFCSNNLLSHIELGANWKRLWIMKNRFVIPT